MARWVQPSADLSSKRDKKPLKEPRQVFTIKKLMYKRSKLSIEVHGMWTESHVGTHHFHFKHNMLNFHLRRFSSFSVSQQKYSDCSTAAGPGGRSSSRKEISISYSSRTVASTEKPSAQSTFSALCWWKKKQKISQSQASCEIDSCIIPHYAPVHWTSTVANLRQR